jgi:uncharacterized protein (DUF4415 family)
MPKSKRALGSDLAKLDATTDEDIAYQIAEDPDTAPELTDEELDAAELYEGDRFVRRVGRPKGSGNKEMVTLRLDRDLLDQFRAGGPGWQTRVNDALRTLASVRPALQVQPATRVNVSEDTFVEMIKEQLRGVSLAEGKRGGAGGVKKRARKQTVAQMIGEVLRTGDARTMREIRRAMRTKRRGENKPDIDAGAKPGWRSSAPKS